MIWGKFHSDTLKNDEVQRLHLPHNRIYPHNNITITVTMKKLLGIAAYRQPERTLLALSSYITEKLELIEHIPSSPY